MHQWRGGECCVSDEVKENVRWKKSEAVVAADTRSHRNGLKKKRRTADYTTRTHKQKEGHIRSTKVTRVPFARRHTPANTIALRDSVAFDTRRYPLLSHRRATATRKQKTQRERGNDGRKIKKDDDNGRKWRDEVFPYRTSVFCHGARGQPHSNPYPATGPICLTRGSAGQALQQCADFVIGARTRPQVRCARPLLGSLHSRSPIVSVDTPSASPFGMALRLPTPVGQCESRVRSVRVTPTRCLIVWMVQACALSQVAPAQRRIGPRRWHQ